MGMSPPAATLLMAAVVYLTLCKLCAAQSTCNAVMIASPRTVCPTSTNGFGTYRVCAGQTALCCPTGFTCVASMTGTNNRCQDTANAIPAKTARSPQNTQGQTVAAAAADSGYYRTYLSHGTTTSTNLRWEFIGVGTQLDASSKTVTCGQQVKGDGSVKIDICTAVEFNALVHQGSASTLTPGLTPGVPWIRLPILIAVATLFTALLALL